ncbi:MAG: T6SS immunity protein Tli4 family protein [Achromobacter sp.]|uniref:T6SS immunity protein Tli4 family protein n=1 Tax=Achromobacter sp. TaxID=134375 RepID=UPI003D017BF0
MRNLKTFCLGRFTVPLPRDSTVSIATSGIEADFSFKRKISRFDFDQLIEKRWLELQHKTHDIYGNPYASPSTRSSPLDGAVIFTYEHLRVTLGSRKPEGDELHETEGFLWRDGHFFYFEPVLNSETDIAATMRNLQVREFDAMPTEAGLCAAGSFFPGPGAARNGEAVRFVFDIPGAPPLQFQFETTTLYSAEQIPGRTPGKANYAAFNNDEFRGQVLRDRRRTILGVAGDEYISAATEKLGNDYHTNISARWHFPGEVGSITRPTIDFSLGLSYDGDTEPARWAHFPENDESGGSPEAHFMALWNAILEGARLR